MCESRTENLCRSCELLETLALIKAHFAANVMAKKRCSSAKRGGCEGGIASKRATLNAKVNIASALAFHTFTADGKSRSCAIDLNNLSLSPALSHFHSLLPSLSLILESVNFVFEITILSSLQLQLELHSYLPPALSLSLSPCL